MPPMSSVAGSAPEVKEPRSVVETETGRRQNLYPKGYPMHASQITPDTELLDIRNTAGPQHIERIMPIAADVLAIAEHYGTAFVEVDGWVNTLIPYPGGSTVVYKAPTGAAVA